MSYAVRFQTNWIVSGLASSVACVLYGAGVAQSIGSVVRRDTWNYATESGGNLTFYAYGTPPQALGTVALPTTTLASVVPGVQILADQGNGQWQLGTVISDGSTTLAGGQSFSASTPAAVPVAGQVLPQPSGQQLSVTLLGTAADSTMWFTVGGHQVACSSTTVGALSHGAPALVNVGSSWTLVQF